MLRECNTPFCVMKALVGIFTHILTINHCYHSFSHFLSLVGVKGYLCVTFISPILVEFENIISYLPAILVIYFINYLCKVLDFILKTFTVSL